jgi:hypothetical protein
MQSAAKASRSGLDELVVESNLTAVIEDQDVEANPYDGAVGCDHLQVEGDEGVATRNGIAFLPTDAESVRILRARADARSAQ